MPAQNPDDPVMWRNTGNGYFNNGQYEEAIKCYFNAIELNPDYVDAWNNLGYTYHKMGKFEEANRCKERINEIKSKPPKTEEIQKTKTEKKDNATILDWIGLIIFFVAIIWAAAIGGLPYALLIILLSGVYVYLDAKKRGIGPQKGEKETMESRTWSPVSWAILVILFWIIFFPLYIIKRNKYTKAVE